MPLPWPDVQLGVLEPRVFAALQPQVYEPEDHKPGEQLLVSIVQFVLAQYRRWVPLAVGVQHLGLGKVRLHRRPGRRIGWGQGWLGGAVRRWRVVHALRLERISGPWLRGDRSEVVKAEPPAGSAKASDPTGICRRRIRSAA